METPFAGDPIAAAATPPGQSGIAVFRVSGTGAAVGVATGTVGTASGVVVATGVAATRVETLAEPFGFRLRVRRWPLFVCLSGRKRPPNTRQPA